jgi:hypothetical protein
MKNGGIKKHQEGTFEPGLPNKIKGLIFAAKCVSNSSGLDVEGLSLEKFLKMF